MYTKEINDRSPLRVFEKSIHGGLGKGNLGVVMSRAGVGKTALLIGIALDDLMRGRKVLHASFEDSLDHVRTFYDEIFEEIRKSTGMADARETHLLVERSRIIHTYRGIEFSTAKLDHDTRFYKAHLDFQPEVVIVDGYDLSGADEAELAALKDYARTHNVELWLTALTHREDPAVNSRGVPSRVARFDAWIAVMVRLEPTEKDVCLRLLKDHENQNVEELHLHLDPRTLLLLKED